ncbi:unnamed protein product [Absidia cylindrospora]
MEGSTTKTKVITPFDTPPPTPQQGLQLYNDNNTFSTLDNSLIPYPNDCNGYDLFGPSIGHPASDPLTNNNNHDALIFGLNNYDDADNQDMANDVLDDDDIFIEIDSTFNSFDISLSSPPPSPLLHHSSDIDSYPILSNDFVLFE